MANQSIKYVPALRASAGPPFRCATRRPLISALARKRISMNASVEKAIERFRSGDRPWQLRSASWFVVDRRGELFPAKYVWALAIGAEPSTFHTSDARRERTGREYSVVRKHDLYPTDKIRGQPVVPTESSEEIRRKALEAKGRPQKRLALTEVFDRNPYVVSETLRRAGGFCEECKSAAPFRRKSDSTPYLESPPSHTAVRWRR